MERRNPTVKSPIPSKIPEQSVPLVVHVEQTQSHSLFPAIESWLRITRLEGFQEVSPGRNDSSNLRALHSNLFFVPGLLSKASLMAIDNRVKILSSESYQFKNRLQNSHRLKQTVTCHSEKLPSTASTLILLPIIITTIDF